MIGVSPDADGDPIASTVTHVRDYSGSEEDKDGGATTTLEASYGLEDKTKKPAKKKTPKQTGPYVSILDR